MLPSIPLAPEPVRPASEQSIGTLVREATTHMSALVRAEVELARVEVTKEIKRGVQGSIFFIIALVIVLFSLFFLFISLAELLADLGLYRSAAYGIVFVFMLLMAGVFGLFGYLRVRKIRAPERTISSLKESAAVLSKLGRSSAPVQTELGAGYSNGAHRA